jgi:pimeloyl-ACP methyl ester carboxylesterase
MVGETGYSLNNLGCDLRTVLEELDIQDAVLVGHSMGGVEVQEFAIHQTDALKKRVRGLVLLSTFSQVPAISPVFSSRFPSSMSLSHLMRRPNLGTVIARDLYGLWRFSSATQKW